jgi:hypothetical protein
MTPFSLLSRISYVAAPAALLLQLLNQLFFTPGHDEVFPGVFDLVCFWSLGVSAAAGIASLYFLRSSRRALIPLTLIIGVMVLYVVLPSVWPEWLMYKRAG